MKQASGSTCQVCFSGKRQWYVFDVDLIHVEDCPNPMCRDPAYYLPRFGTAGWTWG